MATVVDRLHEDHANMRRLLDILDRELDAVEAAENADFDLMRDVMRYLVHYSDAVHHPMEDLVYARLAERSVKARNDLVSIPEQHERIEAQSRRLHDEVGMVADGGLALRTEILKAGRDYSSGLRKHIEMEDLHLFPLVESTLDEEDLDEVQRVLDENEDPVFGKVVKEDYRVLYRHIDEQGR